MKTKQMIKYQYPGDLTHWYCQYKDDPIPKWAINVQDYFPEEDES